MAKYIELEVEGVKAVARLLEEDAPETCRRVWDLLPIEETLRHLSWAGEGAFFKTDLLRDPNFPLENRVSFYHPGTISYRPENVEFALSYGQCQARTLMGNGGNLFANHFAQMEGDYKPFLEMLERTHEEGKKRISVRGRDA